jgi:hypothetical protein
MKRVLLMSVLASGMAFGGAIEGPAAIEARQAPAASSVPTGQTSLGSVRIGRAVMANGQRLPAGTYQVRLTGETAGPPAKGQTPELQRWVEFVRGGQVRGREVVSVVPQAEIKDVAKGAAPAAGSARIEMLKGDDYLRVWIHRGGNHYLIHLPPA